MAEPIKLQVPFVKSVFDYMCSENSASMYLSSKGIKIPPEELRKKGCESIFTIGNCLSAEMSDHLKIPITFALVESGREQSEQIDDDLASFVKYCINRKEPIIASIIPESNWENYQEEQKPIENYLHTILIVGYIPETDYILIHDQSPYTEWDFKEFLECSARTNFTFLIQTTLYKNFDFLFKSHSKAKSS